MTLIPTVKCADMRAAVDFYTRVLDFDHVGTWPAEGEPSFTVLMRGADELHLSTHGGDGVAGQAVAVLTGDADTLHARYLARGLDPSHKPDSPVHQGPTDQTWGTREFYVDDPDGNTLRFIQR